MAIVHPFHMHCMYIRLNDDRLASCVLWHPRHNMFVAFQNRGYNMFLFTDHHINPGLELAEKSRHPSFELNEWYNLDQFDKDLFACALRCWMLIKMGIDINDKAAWEAEYGDFSFDFPKDSVEHIAYNVVC